MKWYGIIAFNEGIEEEPGDWIPTIIKKNFFGDILRPAWNEHQGDKINADLQVTNKLSIVADPFLQNNFHRIAYVTFGGAKWTVIGVEQDPDRPRLTLSLGPIYKGEDDEE